MGIGTEDIDKVILIWGTLIIPVFIMLVDSYFCNGKIIVNKIVNR